MHNIEHFRGMLQNHSTPIKDIVRSELIYGLPHVYDGFSEIYYNLKERVSEFFQVHPHNVIIVGSAKLGFSVAPKKLWKPFDAESDIDVVIVSEKAFTEYWGKLFLFNSNISRTADEDDQYMKFKDYFFRGWIRPDLFGFQYQGKAAWFDFFNEMSRLYGNGRKISGALYYNFDFFEQYHISNLSNIRKLETQK